MSIAVSVVVHPSRILLSLLFLIAALSAAIGVAIFSGWFGNLDPIHRILTGTLPVFMAFFGFYHGVRHRKTLHIDISGAGQIRMAEAASTGPCRSAYSPHLRANGTVVEMMDNSTIWPNLMVLRLRTSDRRIIVVPILQDSVSREAFRALSVACRWIAARGHTQGNTGLEKRSR
jgi:toxin CptA